MEEDMISEINLGMIQDACDLSGFEYQRVIFTVNKLFVIRWRLARLFRIKETEMVIDDLLLMFVRNARGLNEDEIFFLSQMILNDHSVEMSASCEDELLDIFTSSMRILRTTMGRALVNNIVTVDMLDDLPFEEMIVVDSLEQGKDIVVVIYFIKDYDACR